MGGSTQKGPRTRVVATIGPVPVNSPRLPASPQAIAIAVTEIPATAPVPTLANVPVEHSATTIEKPGCTAADETLVVRGHLDGIVKGLWSSSVLQHDLPRLDRAIMGATQMHAPAVVQELSRLRTSLPDVRDTATAKIALDETDKIVPHVGELAKRCGQAGSPALWLKARELSQKVVAGEMTKEQAIQVLQSNSA